MKSGADYKTHFNRNLGEFLPASIVRWAKTALVCLVGLGFSACATNPEPKVTSYLNPLSPTQTVAVLPVQIAGENQKEAMAFRQTLYANLKESKLKLLEPYVVDGLLKKHGLTDPAEYSDMNPARLGEILGADAVVFSKVDQVKRSYLIIHSSVECRVSVRMVDARSGSVLWKTDYTEKDTQGITKIPTGMVAAVTGPTWHFVSNKVDMHQMATKMVGKMTASLKQGETTTPYEETNFSEPVVAAATSRDLTQFKYSEESPESLFRRTEDPTSSRMRKGIEF